MRLDLPLLGDVTGLRGVHLQCHLGTDTLSRARLGPSMTGLDFSAASVEVARALSARCGPHVTYVEAEVYHAAAVLDSGGFDLVFTGIDAICWLHGIRRWAAVVAELLAPGGRLFLREGHPVLWALDDERDDDLLVLGFPISSTTSPTSGRAVAPTSRPRYGRSGSSSPSPVSTGATAWVRSSPPYSRRA